MAVSSLVVMIGIDADAQFTLLLLSVVLLAAIICCFAAVKANFCYDAALCLSVVTSQFIPNYIMVYMMSQVTCDI
jgi:hypothetical protein